MAHTSILPAEREASSIEGLVRLSCGIEEVEDLTAASDGLEDVDSGCESGLVMPSDICI